jgi:hypothetical protein
MFGVGMAINKQIATDVDTHLALVTDALEPWDAGNRFLNFVDRPGDPARLFEPHVYRRLREIKAAYDPSDLMRANHAIAPLIVTQRHWSDEPTDDELGGFRR